jgi:thiol-disulfide isomerase/thioredoxin
MILPLLLAAAACGAGGGPDRGAATPAPPPGDGAPAVAPAASRMAEQGSTPAAATRVAQARASASPGDWTLSCRFTIEVDGRPDRNAELYEKPGTADLIGYLPGGGWFVVRPTTQKVHALADGAAEPGAGRSLRLLAEPTDSGQPLALTPSGLSFDVAGRWLRIIVTPPLLGKTTPDAFLDLCPEYREREESYQPDPDAVREIAGCPRDLTVEIYFGSWCPHCQQVLPKLFKCLRLAGNERLRVEMIGLPRGFGTEPEVRNRNVQGVPTVIVIDAGKEVGRFSGDETTTVERTLAGLVRG